MLARDKLSFDTSKGGNTSVWLFMNLITPPKIQQTTAGDGRAGCSGQPRASTHASADAQRQDTDSQVFASLDPSARICMPHSRTYVHAVQAAASQSRLSGRTARMDGYNHFWLSVLAISRQGSETCIAHTATTHISGISMSHASRIGGGPDKESGLLREPFCELQFLSIYSCKPVAQHSIALVAQLLSVSCFSEDVLRRVELAIFRPRNQQRLTFW